MKKVAICAIEKLENLYLREWVEYYYNMGVDNIILYDNNDEDGEYPHWVIGDFISNGFVIYENARGKHRFQLEAYTECYNKYKNQYEWIGFLDVDEYWYINPVYKIDDILNIEKYPDVFALYINWLCYGDCDLVHYDGRKIQDRFKTPTFPLDKMSNGGVLNWVTKCFIKTQDDEVHVEFLDAAYPVYTSTKNLKFYHINGKEYYFPSTMDFSKTYINHYRTLTIEEFLYRRFGRKGYADYASFHNKDFIMQLFWDQNEWTQEKQDIVDEFFNKFEVINDYPIEI